MTDQSAGKDPPERRPHVYAGHGFAEEIFDCEAPFFESGQPVIGVVDGAIQDIVRTRIIVDSDTHRIFQAIDSWSPKDVKGDSLQTIHQKLNARHAAPQDTSVPFGAH